MIKILITDDSATEAALLKHIFEAEKDMIVVGCATNGKEAIELAATLQPDLITMDINMPIMNGFEAIQLIMMNNPVPIVVISSTLNDKEMDTSFQALDAGAVSVIEKPINAQSNEFNLMRKRMTDTIRSMAEIKVIRRRFIKSKFDLKSPTIIRLPSAKYDIISIGASVGGTQVLKSILSSLPADFPLPIAIVQHMTVGFIQGFCKWLGDYCALKVKCVEHNEILKPGTVYFAPENCHFKVARINNNLIGILQHSHSVAGFCPSITVLMQSIANTCAEKSIGILLTGMGSDGTEGLLEIKQKKGHTLIQDKKSCVVFGMAGVAESLGAVDKIIEPAQLPTYLLQICKT